ncbi:MAG: helix-turn-helix transcriptional regulator [Clostridia bacterium]|nr:helix-turn-helix transcriptional regulator [Clostridia bacterium]
MNSVGSRIKMLRKALSMSADELADKIGKDRATVFRYEKGEIENVPVAVISILAEALYVSPSYLMGWEPDEGEYTERFREAVRFVLETTDTADLEAASKHTLSLQNIRRIAYGHGTVSLDDAHSAADELNTTIGELLEEESQPTTSDELTSTITNKLRSLDSGHRKMILALIDTLLSTQESPSDEPGEASKTVPQQ